MSGVSMSVWRGSSVQRSSSVSSQASKVVSAIAVTLVAIVTLAGCSLGSASTEGQPPIDSNPLTELIKPKVTMSAADGAIGVSPGIPVTLTVADGTLAEVTMLNAAGEVVDGAIAPDQLSWGTTEPLGYNKQYSVEVTAYGLGGATVTTSSFTTSSPGNLTQPYVMPFDGAVVGVGQPVGVQFDENIPDRRAAEAAITVTTNPPVEGAFYWLSNREVRWRPQNFWAPGTTVTVDVNVYGTDLGNGLFGQGNAHTTFTIGDPMIATVDDNTKMITFERNGQVVKTMPTSMGKNDTPTDNGVYIIGSKFEEIVMDSSTYGVAVDSEQGYKLPVQWATRMSYSGIFLHSAPWSVAQQGNTNTSHGCLNLSPADAQWVYNNMKRGDIVIVKNTVGGTLSGVDGLGDWNIPWDVWKAGNADNS